MDLRRIIKEELADFEWMGEINPETDLEPGQLWLRYDGIDQHNAPFFASEIVPRFSDLSMDGDRILMTVDSLCYFTDLFADNDSSRYAYVNKTLAEAIFCEDDYFEPYYDVVYDWEEQVWDLVESDPKILAHVVDHLKDNYVGQIEETITYDGEDVIFDEELLNHLAEQNTSQLGFIIDGYYEFEDLKRELTWAYESSYNTVARDNIYNSAKDAITDLFGEGEWKSYQVRKMDGPVTRHRLVFDVTDLFFDKIEEYFSECFGGCRRYFDPSRYEYGEGEDQYRNEDEAFEEYCEECWEPQHGDFLDMIEEMLYEGNEQFNPSFDEYPSQSDLVEYFLEDIYGRI